MIQASIIIPTRNRGRMLCDLLTSLYALAPQRAIVEIIVIDDASTDDTVVRVKDAFPHVQLLTTPTPTGPSRARNRGANVADGDLLLFLDADGVVESDWLASMIAAHNGERILLGNVMDFSGTRIQSVPRRTTFLGKSLKCRPERANTGPSCNLGVPKSCFEQLGGFDEALPYYFEDSDLCLRAGRAGMSFRFLPEAVFRHHGNERKTGDAIRMQEHNSTYAMLKFYEGDIHRSLTFSLLNAGWMLSRATWWCLRGRCGDSARLLHGWAGAHLRYLRERC